jgi:hypothetical protein
MKMVGLSLMIRRPLKMKPTMAEKRRRKPKKTIKSVFGSLQGLCKAFLEADFAKKSVHGGY